MTGGRARPLAAALGGLLLVVSACAGPEETEATPTSGEASTRPTSGTTSSGTRDPGPGSRLVRRLEAITRAHPGSEISVALGPVGRDGRAQVVGDAPALVAWSTIKVPLALAAADESAAADVEAALTASDNAAAQRLWEGLGPGRAASTAVEEQLRRGGDARTNVPAEVTVPGHSAFGQTRWRLSDQADFTAALPCLSGSSSVTDAMERVVAGQRWGLGEIDGARIKGGWGSTPEGYVVRQLGLLPGSTGETAVALQVRTGTHDQGTAIAGEVARALRQRAAELPTGSCD